VTENMDCSLTLWAEAVSHCSAKFCISWGFCVCCKHFAI